MKIIEYESFDELENSETEWNLLAAKSLDSNPFLTYEWLHTWWQHFGKGRELRIFVTKGENGEVSLIVPTMYSKRKVLTFKVQKLEFVSTPDSDYNVFLVMNFDNASKAVKPLITNIEQTFADADCVELEEVPEESYTARLLSSIESICWKFSSKVINSCPYLLLPTSYETFLRNLGSNMRRNLKRWEKQANKDYEIDFVEYSRIGTVREAMEVFFRLHQKRWQSKNELGVFATSAYRDFHLDLAEAFCKKGWLTLFFLTFNGEPVSAVYGYRYREKIYGYLSGFDPEYSTYRPGYLAFGRLIKHGIENSLKEFDFMRGMEKYKAAWTTSIRKNLELRGLKKTAKTALYDYVMNDVVISYLRWRIGKLSSNKLWNSIKNCSGKKL